MAPAGSKPGLTYGVLPLTDDQPDGRLCLGLDQSSSLELLVPCFACAVRGGGASDFARGEVVLPAAQAGDPVQIIEGSQTISGRLVRVECSILHVAPSHAD